MPLDPRPPALDPRPSPVDQAADIPPPLPGTLVRITGGPLNGLIGRLSKLGDSLASVLIDFEGRRHEVITSRAWLDPYRA